MKILKPKFWNIKLNLYSIFLFPLSLIFIILVFLKKKFSFEKKLNISVICVGNVYVGGTGKTPLSIFIADQLKDKKKTAIVKKYYKNQIDECELVRSNSCSLIVNNKRRLAIEEAKNRNFNLVILDDGFQDHSIAKNLNIICFNSKQLDGNSMVFPSGPLREPMSCLKRAHIVIINGEKNLAFEKKILSISSEIKIYYSNYSPTNINQFKSKKLFAFAGIGNPENFFDTLKIHNLDIQKKIAFPDHYKFDKSELIDMISEAEKKEFELITTEKDFHRIKNYGFKDIKYLKLKLEIKQKDKLMSQILSYL